MLKIHLLMVRIRAIIKRKNASSSLCSHYDLDGSNDGSDDLSLHVGRGGVPDSQTKKSSYDEAVTNILIERVGARDASE